jgi:uncharacterized membrane protein
MVYDLRKVSLSYTATLLQLATVSYTIRGQKKNEYIDESKALMMVVITTVMIKIIIVLILFNGAFSSSGYAGCPVSSGQCSTIYK